MNKWVSILFFLLRPFYKKDYWEKRAIQENSPWSAEELFVFEMVVNIIGGVIILSLILLIPTTVLLPIVLVIYFVIKLMS